MRKAFSRFVLSVVLVFPVAVSAAEQVEAVLADFEQRGYPSPLVALQRLQAAAPLGPDTAPVLRGRYHAAVARYAIPLGDQATTDAAMTALSALAEREGCQPCEVQWRLRETLRLAVRADVVGAEVHLRKAVALSKDVDPELGFDLLSMQSVWSGLAGQHAKAIEYAVQASQWATRHRLPASQAAALNLMMRANLGYRDMDRALDLGNEAYAQGERIGFTYLMAVVRANQVYAYSARNEPDKQYAALMDVLRLTDAVPGMEAMQMSTLINLSAHYQKARDYDKAVNFANRAERLALTRGDKMGQAAALSARGLAMLRDGKASAPQLQAGLALMAEAVELSDQAGIKFVTVDLLDSLAHGYESALQPRNALETLRKLAALNAEIGRGEGERAILELQEQYSGERKTREIERLSLNNARREAEVDARAWQTRVWIMLAVTLLLGAIMLIQGLQRMRKRNRMLELDNATLNEQSSQDTLTGVFNRRHCQNLMEHQAMTLVGRSRDRDYKACVSFILLDADHFKRVNDTYGHAAGDAVLQVVAKRLKTIVRENDVVVRWGGEEFVLILPGTPAEGLQVVAERMLSVIADEPVVTDGAIIPVTVSAGCVTWPAFPGQHWEDAMHVADLALYLAKSSGRNRATCLLRVDERANLERMRTDLVAARDAGDVVLQTVVGP